MDKDTAVIILSSVSLLVALIGSFAIILGILLLSKETSKIPELMNRVSSIELSLQQIAEDIRLELNDGAEIMWRSADGKYQGASLEDLLHKMTTDPDGPLSSEEIDAIKSVFDKISGQSNNDDDEPQEPWRKN